MKKNNYLILDNEFLLYCQLNNIDNIDKLAKDTFSRGFTILKYGEIPHGNKEINVVEKIVEKEIIKEVIVEKIVEVVKEVPIKTDDVAIIKDELKINKLLEENNNLKAELDKIKKSLDNLNKAKYMKNSDMSSLYGE